MMHLFMTNEKDQGEIAHIFNTLEIIFFKDQ